MIAIPVILFLGAFVLIWLKNANTTIYYVPNTFLLDIRNRMRANKPVVRKQVLKSISDIAAMSRGPTPILPPSHVASNQEVRPQTRTLSVVRDPEAKK